MAGFIFEDLDFNYCFDLAQRNPESFLRAYYSNIKKYPSIFDDMEDVIRHLVLSDERFRTLDYYFFHNKKYSVEKLKEILKLNNFDKETIDRFAAYFQNTLESFNSF